MKNAGAKWQLTRSKTTFLCAYSYIYENSSKSKPKNLTNVFASSMLGFNKFKDHKSSKILHAGPLIHKTTQRMTSEQDHL